MPLSSPLQITTTFPKDPQYTFCSTQRFPIENRDILGEIQVSNYVISLKSSELQQPHDTWHTEASCVLMLDLLESSGAFMSVCISTWHEQPQLSMTLRFYSLRGQRKLHILFSFLFVCVQNFHSLATYLSQCTSTAFLDIVSDFHLLLFLVTNDVMPLSVRHHFEASSPFVFHLSCRNWVRIRPHSSPVWKWLLVWGCFHSQLLFMLTDFYTGLCFIMTIKSKNVLLCEDNNKL